MTARATSSYWSDTASFSRYPKLDRDLHVDVAVVGGGITGLTAAYLIAKSGRTVALVERRRLSGVDTSSTTAHLTAVTDLRLTELIEAFGEDHARAAWDAGFAAIDLVNRNIRELEADCHFSWISGYLHGSPFRAPSERDAADLKREAEAAINLGFDARFVEAVPFMDRPGVEYAGQARFHPLKYLSALARGVERHGGLIFEDSNADEVRDDPLTVVVGDRTIECSAVVIGTHNPIVGRAGILHATLLQTKIALYSSYVVGGRVPKGTVPDALFWDLDDPYHYLRIDRQDDADFVIFGGEDHKTGQDDAPADRFEELEAAAKKLVPRIDVTHRWSGQVIETNDGLPFIGEMGERQFAATGFAGNGMTFGTLGGMMAADAVSGRDNPWASLFDTARTKVRGGLWDYLKENKDYPYYLIRDRFAGAEARSLRDIPRGTGRITDVNGTRAAVFRADDGSITALSPVCTHMGCHVQWNDAERTWDCPCHGSRFMPRGEVLSGPAESPLEEIAVPEHQSR